MPASSLRRGKFAIPKVNPNPRPPNEPRYTKGKPRTPPGATYDPVVPAPPTLNEPPQAPPTPAEQIAAATTQPTSTPLTAAGISGLLPDATSALGLSSYSPTQGQPDPRDAEYWKNVNNLLFNTQGKIRDLNLAGERATLDYGKNTFDLNTTRGRNQRSLGEAAISQGLANSGWLARNETEDAADFLRSDEDLRTGYQRGADDRKTAVSQAIQDYIAGEGDQAGTALSRWLATQGTTAQTGDPINKGEDLTGGAPESYVDTTTNPPSIVTVDKQGGEYYVDTTHGQNQPKPKPSAYKPKKRR